MIEVIIYALRNNLIKELKSHLLRITMLSGKTSEFL